MLALGLDPEINPGALSGLKTINIVHGPDALPLAWLITGWLASRLNWTVQAAQLKPNQWIEWRFNSDHGEIAVHVEYARQGHRRTIEKMDLQWFADKQAGRALFLTEGHHIITEEESSSIPPVTRPVYEIKIEQLVAGQMAHRYSDKLFTDAIKMAADMSAALDK